MIRNSLHLLFIISIAFVGSTSQAQTKDPVCRLGDIKPEFLAKTDSLRIINEDISLFKKNAELLHSLSYIEMYGEFSDDNMLEAIATCNSLTSINTLKFSNNELIELPGRMELPGNITTLIISDNELINYSSVLDNISGASSLKRIEAEVYTIFDFPSDPHLPVGLKELVITNIDDDITENEITIRNSLKNHAFDFTLPDRPEIRVKYISTAGILDSDEYQELSKRFRSYHNYSFALTNFSSDRSYYIPKYDHVTPPIKNLDIDRSVYTINNGIDNLLIHPSGTRIFIPANCFLNEKNKNINGNVEIAYREFRDPVDILVSGIPMKYDSAGEVNHFESAGMFEITASQNSDPLILKKDKQIKMNFVTTSKDSTYNFYAFNDSTGNWEYKTKPEIITSATRLNDPNSPAMNTYRALLRSRIKTRDTTRFRQRFESPEFLYTVRYDSIKRKNNTYWFSKRHKERGRITETLIKINRVRKTKNGEVIFKLRFYNETHPELSEFNSIYFVSNENLDAAQFKSRYSSKKSFSDVRIYQKGQQVEIRLKGKRNEFKTISADLATLDDKGNIHKLRSVTAPLKRYSRKLKNREKEFDKLVKSQKNFRDKEFEIKNTKDLDLYAYNGSRTLMSPAEKNMTQKEWMDYYQQLLRNQKQALDTSAATANNLVNSLSLDGMGIYNCDQIQRINDPVEIFADYHNKEAEELKPSATYIIDKKINAVLQYNGYRGFSADKIAFSKSSDAENILLAIKPDGTIGIYKPQDFKEQRFRNHSRFDFKVQEVNVNFTSVAQLKKYLGL